MNKKYEINIEQNKRQIELLEKYFTLDKERKTVIVFLKYSKASEIFENSIACLQMRCKEGKKILTSNRTVTIMQSNRTVTRNKESGHDWRDERTNFGGCP